MKKILMVTYDSPNIDRRIYLFADTLQKAGYSVSILTPYAQEEVGFEHINVINLVEKNSITNVTSSIFIKETLRKILPMKIFGMVRDLYRLIFTKDGYIQNLDSMINKAVSIKADYYIANDLPTLPIVKACIEQNGGKFIYDAHEFFLGQDVFSKRQKENLEQIEKSIFPMVDFFITVNDDIRKLFFEKYGEKKSEIIFNATKCNCEEKKYLHDLIGIDRNEKILLYQGGFIEKRKLENLIYISKYLNNSKLVMLGWGTTEKQLKNLAEDLGVFDKKVFFVPKISQKELVSYTSSATIGIIPYDGYDLNTKYCTPNKLFEFVCAGIPIVHNDNLHTVGNIIKSYKIGFPINVNDYENTAKRIEELMLDVNTMNSFKENIESSREFLSWDNEKVKILNIFKAFNE